MGLGGSHFKFVCLTLTGSATPSRSTESRSASVLRCTRPQRPFRAFPFGLVSPSMWQNRTPDMVRLEILVMLGKQQQAVGPTVLLQYCIRQRLAVSADLRALRRPWLVADVRRGLVRPIDPLVYQRHLATSAQTLFQSSFPTRVPAERHARLQCWLVQ
jgi:hypothetical protein